MLVIFYIIITVSGIKVEESRGCTFINLPVFKILLLLQPADTLIFACLPVFSKSLFKLFIRT